MVPIVITTSSLPPGTVQSAYSAKLSAIGGNPPYHWSLTKDSDEFPPGMTLKPNGVISGTPTKAGTYSFTVKVVDTKRKGTSRTLDKAKRILSITVS